MLLNKPWLRQELFKFNAIRQMVSFFLFCHFYISIVFYLFLFDFTSLLKRGIVFLIKACNYQFQIVNVCFAMCLQVILFVFLGSPFALLHTHWNKFYFYSYKHVYQIHISNTSLSFLFYFPLRTFIRFSCFLFLLFSLVFLFHNKHYDFIRRHRILYSLYLTLLKRWSILQIFGLFSSKTFHI